MKFNVIYNKEIKNYKKSLEILTTVLTQNNIKYKLFELNNLENYGDFSFVIGGDGTILKVARYYSEFSIPVLGINNGRLGYLSQIQVEEIENVIVKILNKEFYIEERIMLKSNGNLALNDFIIKGCNSSRTSKFYLEINNNKVCDYIADGLIISTPTGSTAYGLSAGGPILHPTVDAIVIVPICPHTLNVRPLVIPLGEKIIIKSSDEKLLLSSDGQEANEIDHVSIDVSKYKARLVFFNNENFYSVLRNKLHWGISPCNR